MGAFRCDELSPVAGPAWELGPASASTAGPAGASRSGFTDPGVALEISAPAWAHPRRRRAGDLQLGAI